MHIRYSAEWNTWYQRETLIWLLKDHGLRNDTAVLSAAKYTLSYFIWKFDPSITFAKANNCWWIWLKKSIDSINFEQISVIERLSADHWVLGTFMKLNTRDALYLFFIKFRFNKRYSGRHSELSSLNRSLWCGERGYSFCRKYFFR